MGTFSTNRASGREHTPLGRSTSPSVCTAAVRYTRVAWLAPRPATREVRDAVHVLPMAGPMGGPAEEMRYG